jgi:hypothetical protein
VERLDDTRKEDDMTGTTTRITNAVRQALRRLDAWTLTAFNPGYPARNRRS